MPSRRTGVNELNLTRSKAKHPPAKVMVEAEKVKSKVQKSNTNRRQKNMTEWHRQRIAAMDAEIAAKNATKEDGMELADRMDALSQKWDADDQRLSAERDARIAGEIDAKAQQLMGSDPTLDYSTATRLALAGDERFARTGDADDQDTDLAGAVERRMKADPTNYGDDEGEPVGSVENMSAAEYQSQVKEAMRNRGYDVD
jgi:hypothetical protein